MPKAPRRTNGSGRNADAIECVVLTSFESQISFLRNVFRTEGIRVHHAESLEEADFLLTVTGCTVFLADAVFEGGYWHAAVALQQESHPLVGTLVIADPVDRPFVEDAFVRGACGVVWRPFQFAPVMRQIRTVHEASNDRRAMAQDRQRPTLLPR